MEQLASFCAAVPKAELHLHVEGTLEPELLLRLAQRNRLGVEAAPRSFTCLADFLKQYYDGMAVLLHQEDFKDLLGAYLKRAAADGVRHAELFFDPQAHLSRGVSWEAMLGGFQEAIAGQEQVTCLLIPCFLRHLGAEAAHATLDTILAEPRLRSSIVGIGLDSHEPYDTPAPWASLFDKARQAGLRLVCHSGEEESAAHMLGVLTELRVDRIDHGVKCLDDAAVLARVVSEQVPLTTCPISNLRLRVYGDAYFQKLGQLLASGACVTINSDDPAYFTTDAGSGAYIASNYEYAAQAAGWEGPEALTNVAELARRSWRASFLGETAKAAGVQSVDVALAAALGKA